MEDNYVDNLNKLREIANNIKKKFNKKVYKDEPNPTKL